VAASSKYSDEADDSLITEINVTPLVDVVLVLLIVLMVTMPAIVSADLLAEREMDVLLPEASSARALTSEPNEIIVNVHESGRYTVQEKAHTTASLRELFMRQPAEAAQQAGVLIRADRHCHLQSVITVLNLCQEANLRKCRVVTTE
jgi:biopolymer transport protein ExbD